MQNVSIENYVAVKRYQEEFIAKITDVYVFEMFV